ncbi:MAG TPA: PilX N-terminal domain-containing pilus assembly protein [Burkholderiaceae bacterium]|nr:PilX N-terminal domain-containing pilus assembly protein [Burkholderiaceae bacterium]
MREHAACLAARRQRGAAALVVTLMLFFAMVLTAVFVNRNLLVEQLAAANHDRAAQAFEAAEAGLEWALAQLNNPQRLGADCTLSAAAGVSAFRAHYLRADARSGRFTPAEWNDAGVTRPLRASCLRTSTGWACSCPSDAAPSLAIGSDPGTAPSFSIEFFAAERPGAVRIVSTGCSRATSVCIANDDARRNAASARVEASVVLVPALRTPPAAALTARAAVVSPATFGAHNADPESGLAIHAGGAISAPAARLTAPAGAGLGDGLLPNDAALAGSTAAAFFAKRFGLGKADWSTQPGVTRIDCSIDCLPALRRAIDTVGTPPLVWVDGDLVLEGPVTVGTLERPVALIVSGAVRLGGAVRFHGVLYAGAVTWSTPDTGALLRGALLSEAGYGGDGTPALVYDRAVLATLQRASGSFVRVSGSWRDF